MSSTTRCFQIGEILLIIVKMTCKAVSNFALPILWSEVDIACIMELLVDDDLSFIHDYTGATWTEFGPRPTADYRRWTLTSDTRLDLSRIDQHRGWVRTLRWFNSSLSESALGILSEACAQSGPLCPNLHGIQLSQIPDEWICRYSPIFQYNQIPKLLLVETPREPLHSGDLRKHPALSIFPNLERFCGWWSLTDSSQRLFVSVLPPLPNLRHIQTCAYLCGDALMDIALSPLVSEASFYTNADDLHSTVRQATKSGNYIFPALQALQLHVDRIFILPAVLSAIHSSSLTTLSLHFEDCDTTLDKIFGTLGCSSAQHSLKTLALDALGIMDDPQVPTVTCKTLKDVARLKALQNLWLWIPKIMLDEKELPATLFTFPEGLSDLYIYTCQSDGLPLDALQHFASCCPQVKLLGLTLNAQPVLSHLPQNWLSASRLEYLNLENAPVVRPGETGKYLSALFPRMGLVQLERLSGSPTREERLQICRAMEEAAGGDMIVDGDMKSCSTPSDREARYWNVFEWV